MTDISTKTIKAVITNTTPTFKASIVQKGADGLDGNGIASIALTSGDHSPGTTDTYTITFDDETTTTFTVYNGAGVGDVLKAINITVVDEDEHFIGANVETVLAEVGESLGLKADKTYVDNQDATLTAQLADIENILNGSDDKFVRALGTKLSSKTEPSCVVLLGDSTGNEETEWFYLTMQWLKDKINGYTFIYRLWNDAHQGYSGHKTLKSGEQGEGYAVLTTTSLLNTPHNSSFAITGDLDVSAKVALDNWRPVSSPMIIARLGSSGSRSWGLGISSGGYPYLWWSEDGINFLGGQNSAYQSSANIPLETVEKWVRCTVDVDNGAGGFDIKYYTSDDGETWTQLGTTRTGTSVTSFYQANTPLYLGRRQDAQGMDGKFYKAILKDGIGGKVIASPDLGMVKTMYSSTFQDVEGNVYSGSVVSRFNGARTFLILNGSHPGSSVVYHADETRFALLTPIETDLAFISHSHNYNETFDIETVYQGLCDQIKTKYPNGGLVLSTQNPQTTPRIQAQIHAHASRNRQISLIAAKNGYGLIDAFKAFMLSTSEGLVNVDGIHPSTLTGSPLWSKIAQLFLSKI